jgi:cyclic pyranopterin monophosphate synthase
MEKLSHTDDTGRARMVDTGAKTIQHRIAIASGRISLAPETLVLIRDNLMKKGDVLAVAEIAGVQAAKRCSDLIPLCHNIVLDHVGVRLTPDDKGVMAQSEVSCTGRTGVEMEALTAVNIALLTVYDMCKAVDKTMIISDVYLVKKEKHDIA